MIRGKQDSPSKKSGVQKEKKVSQFWVPLISHINRTWRDKKGSDYPFVGRDFRLIKNAVSNFQEWGVMALWDEFLEKENDWIKSTGYSVYAFSCCLPWLVDAPNWKWKARDYEEKMFPAPPIDASSLIKKESP